MRPIHHIQRTLYSTLRTSGRFRERPAGPITDGAEKISVIASLRPEVSEGFSPIDLVLYRWPRTAVQVFQHGNAKLLLVVHTRATWNDERSNSQTCGVPEHVRRTVNRSSLPAASVEESI